MRDFNHPFTRIFLALFFLFTGIGKTKTEYKHWPERKFKW